jgi:competence protein ComEA
VTSRIVFAVVVLLFATPDPSFSRAGSSQDRPQSTTSHGRWTVLNNCVYVSNRADDGDSFYVSVSGRLYLFRLYFVDAPETDFDFKDRVDEQAKYFGISNGDVIRAGKVAKDFTRSKLSQPFTVRTCFQDALGRSRMQRLYAIVQTATGDLGEQLVENGLARIHGASANPVGLPLANVEWQKLRQLEIEAKGERVGGWGVNFGRIMARSEKSKNRDPVDPFEAFFHPERAQSTDSGSGSATASDIVAINPPGAGINPTAPATMERPTPQPIRAEVISKSNAVTLNVNTATQEQLENIPGIGPVLAQRIIDARPFNDADDLHKVKGIGDTRYQKLRPFFE